MNKKKLINATKWSVISEVISKLISPITTMMLARILTTEVFGIVASITAITSLADLLTDAGFNAYIVQHQFTDLDEKKNVYNVSFWSNFSISVLLYIIIFFNRFTFARLVGAQGYENALIVASLALLLTSVSSIELAIMKKELRFKYVGLIKVVSKMVPFLITIPLALAGLEYWSLILGTLLGEMINVILSLYFGGFIPCFSYKIDCLKKVFSFSIWAFLESILEWLVSNISILTLGTVYGLYSLGIFKTGLNIISQITTSVYALYSNVYKSAIAKEQYNIVNFHEIFLNFQKYTSILSIPLGVGTFLYKELATNILLGDKWSDATTLVGLWGMASILSIAFGNFYSDAIRAKGYPRKLVFIDSIYLIAIISILCLSHKIEFKKFCILFCAIKLIQPTLQTLFGQKICELPFFAILKQCLPQIMATFAMAVVNLIFKLNRGPNVKKLIGVVVSIAVYFAVFVILLPDKKKLLEKIRKTKWMDRE